MQIRQEVGSSHRTEPVDDVLHECVEVSAEVIVRNLLDNVLDARVECGLSLNQHIVLDGISVAYE